MTSDEISNTFTSLLQFLGSFDCSTFTNVFLSSTTYTSGLLSNGNGSIDDVSNRNISSQSDFCFSAEANGIQATHRLDDRRTWECEFFSFLVRVVKRQSTDASSWSKPEDTKKLLLSFWKLHITF